MALTEATPRNRTVLAAGPKAKVTLSGTVMAGDLIGYSGGWVRAKATVGTAIQAVFVALEAGVSGGEIEVAREAVISGFTGGTPGAPLYLEEGAGAGGGYTETEPTTLGDVNTVIGGVMSATQVGVAISARPGSTHS